MNTASTTLLFVYGTLKRGCCNHRMMAGAVFVAPARTVPGFQLHDLGGFPAIAAVPADRDGVVGEVWSLNSETLARLDRFEGVHQGLYHRAPIALLTPFAHAVVDAYFPALPPTNRPRVGAEWRE